MSGYRGYRKFREFLAKIDVGFVADVRWLSTKNCLQRFFALPKEISIFLKDDVKSNTGELVDAALTFLTDLTSHFNKLNLQLQGKQQDITNII